MNITKLLVFQTVSKLTLPRFEAKQILHASSSEAAGEWEVLEHSLADNGLTVLGRTSGLGANASRRGGRYSPTGAGRAVPSTGLTLKRFGRFGRHALKKYHKLQ